MSRVEHLKNDESAIAFVLDHQDKFGCWWHDLRVMIDGRLVRFKADEDKTLDAFLDIWKELIRKDV